MVGEQAPLPLCCCCCKITQQDVACSVLVPVALEFTDRALEDLAAAELVMNEAAATARLARVRLTDDDHTTPWILASLVLESRAEAVV